MRRGVRGITLAELMVTIAILGLVLALLGFPLYSAFSYIQKATARGEAQRAGLAAAKELTRELALAAYVFDIPPDGSWVAFLRENAESSARSLGMVSDFAGGVSFVRYARMLDFPWQTTGELMLPDYASATVFETYSAAYQPFHRQAARGQRLNPYLLTRYETNGLTWNDVSAQASAFSLDITYPMRTYNASESNTLRHRRYRNDLIAVTPYGDDWDVSRFVVTPRRVSNEALVMQTDARGRKDPDVFLARYPLWAGRTRDLDALTTDADRLAVFGRSDEELTGLVAEQWPLYPWNPADAADKPDRNPFGYQISVYDADGNARYKADAPGGMAYSRHFMEWPPIDRPDWDDEHPLWTREDIHRQRLEGKVIFAQPMRLPPDRALWSLSDYVHGTPVALKVPEGTGNKWDIARTRLVAAPRRITLSNGVENRTFTLVEKAPSALSPGEYCVAQREGCWVAFGDDLSGVWGISAEEARRAEYTISDAQPTDVVVATYSTRAVLSVALTVSRRDHAARTAAQSKQDYVANLHVEARNAARRARRDR